MNPHLYPCPRVDSFSPHGCTCYATERDYALDADSNPNDVRLTVVFTDGREVGVDIMIPTSGEAVVMRDGFVLAEDRAMRCYTFPNVSHWYTDAI